MRARTRPYLHPRQPTAAAALLARCLETAWPVQLLVVVAHCGKRGEAVVRGEGGDGESDGTGWWMVRWWLGTVLIGELQVECWRNEALQPEQKFEFVPRAPAVFPPRTASEWAGVTVGL